MQKSRSEYFVVRPPRRSRGRNWAKHQKTFFLVGIGELKFKLAVLATWTLLQQLLPERTYLSKLFRILNVSESNMKYVIVTANYGMSPFCSVVKLEYLVEYRRDICK